MYNRARTSRQPMARAAYEASRCVGQTCRGEPRVTKSRKPERALVANHRARGPQENPTERSVGETWGQRVRNRRPKGRSKSSAVPVDGRRLGPGKASSCSRRRGGSGLGGSRRIGESKNAHREKARTGIERGLRQGCQRHGCAGERVEKNAPDHSCAIRRSDAERREAFSSPVSMGGHPSSTRPTKSR